MRNKALIFAAAVVAVCASSLFAVEVSTATGNVIRYDDKTGTAVIEGNAEVHTSTAILKADKITIRPQAKEGDAEGNVTVVQDSTTLQGQSAKYNWQTSTGTILKARGSAPPYSFESEKIVQTTPEFYEMEGTELTTCDEVPPHYKVKAGRSRYWKGKRISLSNARMVPDDTPIFWMPFYSKSLEKKKYSLRIEPGHTNRDGTIIKTIFGYPFSEHTYTKLRWDYLENTGDGLGVEHRYFLPNMQGNFDSYYIEDNNPDPQPKSRRYTILWNHYQRVTNRLTINSKFDLKSDQVFGNEFQGVGNQVFVENSQRGILSEAGLTYQFPVATMEALFNRQDKFDNTVSSSNFIGKLTLPRLSFNTIPLTFKRFPFYTSFNGYWTNETVDRTSPQQALRYRRSAAVGTQIRKEYRFDRKWTITPQASYTETWQDSDFISTNTANSKDVYIGRYTLGTDVRRRFYRLLDLTVGYRYGVRFRANQTRRDEVADDRGIETNQFTNTVAATFGRSNRVALTSGVDVRKAPRSASDKYDHFAERITPPSLDLQVEIRPRVSFYFRETYALFDPSTKSNIRRPLNTSAEFQVGAIDDKTFFSQGMSYTRPFASDPDTELRLYNKLRFYLSPKWYIDGYLSYRAVGPKGLDYRKTFPIEKTIRVIRDLHCWLLRMEFSSRPGRTEASFYIDLKTNVSRDNNLFGPQSRSEYTTRDTALDDSKVFPAE